MGKDDITHGITQDEYCGTAAVLHPVPHMVQFCKMIIDGVVVYHHGSLITWLNDSVCARMYENSTSEHPEEKNQTHHYKIRIQDVHIT